MIKRLTHDLRAQGKRVQLAALSGAAAQRLSPNAQTVHSALRIYPKTTYMSPVLPTDELYAQLKNTDVLVRIACPAGTSSIATQSSAVYRPAY